MTNELLMPMILIAGLAIGLIIGWFAWRLPMVFAEQRGHELDADGLTICSKEVAAAGRAALLRDNAEVSGLSTRPPG